MNIINIELISKIYGEKVIYEERPSAFSRGTRSGS